MTSLFPAIGFSLAAAFAAGPRPTDVALYQEVLRSYRGKEVLGEHRERCDETRRFLNDRRNVAMGATRRVITVSKLFD